MTKRYSSFGSAGAGNDLGRFHRPRSPRGKPRGAAFKQRAPESSHGFHLTAGGDVRPWEPPRGPKAHQHFSGRGSGFSSEIRGRGGYNIRGGAVRHSVKANDGWEGPNRFQDNNDSRANESQNRFYRDSRERSETGFHDRQKSPPGSARSRSPFRDDRNAWGAPLERKRPSANDRPPDLHASMNYRGYRGRGRGRRGMSFGERDISRHSSYEHSAGSRPQRPWEWTNTQARNPNEPDTASDHTHDEYGMHQNQEGQPMAPFHDGGLDQRMNPQVSQGAKKAKTRQDDGADSSHPDSKNDSRFTSAPLRSTSAGPPLQSAVDPSSEAHHGAKASQDHHDYFENGQAQNDLDYGDPSDSAVPAQTAQEPRVNSQVENSQSSSDATLRPRQTSPEIHPARRALIVKSRSKSPPSHPARAVNTPIAPRAQRPDPSSATSDLHQSKPMKPDEPSSVNNSAIIFDRYLARIQAAERETQPMIDTARNGSRPHPRSEMTKSHDPLAVRIPTGPRASKRSSVSIRQPMQNSMRAKALAAAAADTDRGRMQEQKDPASSRRPSTWTWTAPGKDTEVNSAVRRPQSLKSDIDSSDSKPVSRPSPSPSAAIEEWRKKNLGTIPGNPSKSDFASSKGTLDPRKGASDQFIDQQSLQDGMARATSQVDEMAAMDLDDDDIDNAQQDYDRNLRRLELQRPPSPHCNAEILDLLDELDALACVIHTMKTKSGKIDVEKGLDPSHVIVGGLPSPSCEENCLSIVSNGDEEEAEMDEAEKDTSVETKRTKESQSLALRSKTPPIESLPFLVNGPPTPFSEYEDLNEDSDREETIKDLIWERLDGEETIYASEIASPLARYRQDFKSWRRTVEALDQESKRKEMESRGVQDLAALDTVAEPVVSHATTLSTARPRRMMSEYAMDAVMKESMETAAREERLRREQDEREAQVYVPVDTFNPDREAIIPAMLNPMEEDEKVLMDMQGYVEPDDVLLSLAYVPAEDPFSREEHKEFEYHYVTCPKKFGEIAARLKNQNLTYKDCVRHYYASKRAVSYKNLEARFFKTGRGKRFVAASDRANVGRSNKALLPANKDSIVEIQTRNIITESGRPKRAAAPTFGDVAAETDAGSAANGPSSRRLMASARTGPSTIEKTKARLRQQGSGTKPGRKPKTKEPGQGKGYSDMADQKDDSKENDSDSGALDAESSVNTLAAAPEGEDSVESVTGSIQGTGKSSLHSIKPGRKPGRPKVEGKNSPLPRGPRAQSQEANKREGTAQAATLAATPDHDGIIGSEDNPIQIMQSKPPVETWSLNSSESLKSRGTEITRNNSEHGQFALSGRAGSNIVETTSYWSVPEKQDFRTYIAYYGTNWQAIAASMKTKTQQMIKNYYQRETDPKKGPSAKELEDAANQANQRRALGIDLGPAPMSTPIQKKRAYDMPSTNLAAAGVSQKNNQNEDGSEESHKPGVRQNAMHEQQQQRGIQQSSSAGILPHNRPSAGPLLGTFSQNRPQIYARPLQQEIEKFRQDGDGRDQRVRSSPAPGKSIEESWRTAASMNRPILSHDPLSRSSSSLQSRELSRSQISAADQSMDTDAQSQARAILVRDPLKDTVAENKGNEARLAYYVPGRDHSTNLSSKVMGKSAQQSLLHPTEGPHRAAAPGAPFSSTTPAHSFARPSSFPVSTSLVTPSSSAPKRSNISALLNDEPSEPKVATRTLDAFESALPGPRSASTSHQNTPNPLASMSRPHTPSDRLLPPRTTDTTQRQATDANMQSEQLLRQYHAANSNKNANIGTNKLLSTDDRHPFPPTVSQNTRHSPQTMTKTASYLAGHRPRSPGSRTTPASQTYQIPSSADRRPATEVAPMSDVNNNRLRGNPYASSSHASQAQSSQSAAFPDRPMTQQKTALSPVEQAYQPRQQTRHIPQEQDDLRDSRYSSSFSMPHHQQTHQTHRVDAAEFHHRPRSAAREDIHVASGLKLSHEDLRRQSIQHRSSTNVAQADVDHGTSTGAISSSSSASSSKYPPTASMTVPAERITSRDRTSRASILAERMYHNNNVTSSDDSSDRATFRPISYFPSSQLSSTVQQSAASQRQQRPQSQESHVQHQQNQHQQQQQQQASSSTYHRHEYGLPSPKVSLYQPTQSHRHGPSPTDPQAYSAHLQHMKWEAEAQDMAERANRPRLHDTAERQ